MTKQPKLYVITSTKPMTGRSYTSRPLTIDEAVEYYGYTLECGVSWSYLIGNKKINRKPTTIKSLISNLNKASSNTARNGCGDYYEVKEFDGVLDTASV